MTQREPRRPVPILWQETLGTLSYPALRIYQPRGPGSFLAMLTPVTGVLSIAVQGRQHLPVTIGEPHALDHQVLPILGRQAIRQPQSQGQRPIVRDAGHAQLTAGRLIPAAQHEELVAASLPPVPEPLLVAGLTVLRQVVLLAPQALGTKAQPQPTGCQVSSLERGRSSSDMPNQPA